MKITEYNKMNFFKNVKVGDVFTYSLSFFPKEIKEIALKDEVVVEYCTPETDEYKEHGCYTMKVTACKKESNLFDNVDGIISFYINGVTICYKRI